MEYICEKIKEPLILEPEDYPGDEWTTILKIFGMEEAERIVVSDFKLEAYGKPSKQLEEILSKPETVTTVAMEGPNKFKTVEYIPTCRYGYIDCICDRAYIKATYPEWYEELANRPGPDSCDLCEDGDYYDDEDK